MRARTRFHALTPAILALLAACEPRRGREPSESVQLPTSDGEAVYDTAFVMTADEPATFLARFPELRRLAAGSGTLLYSPRTAEVIDRTRAALPASHPLHLVEDFAADDRVLVRWTSPSGRRYFVVFTEGPSGDPGFYLADDVTGRETPGLWGEVLALADHDAPYVFQRTNSDFPRTKRLDVKDGALVETDSSRYALELRSVALAPLLLRKSPDDSTVVARIAAGDSVFVYEALTGRQEGYLLRTAAGAEGFVRLPSRQCPYSLIRRLCYLGD